MKLGVSLIIMLFDFFCILPLGSSTVSMPSSFFLLSSLHFLLLSHLQKAVHEGTGQHPLEIPAPEVQLPFQVSLG